MLTLDQWGDAPVHSLAAALLLHPTEIHHFADFGYEHPPFQYCPYLTSNGEIPDLSKANLDELENVGCNCNCGNESKVLQPICLNKMRNA